MRTSGIINTLLQEQISRLRHTDTFVVADAGLPLPEGTVEVDLAVVYGLPGFVPVLEAILAETTVEGCLAAEEMDGSPAGSWIREHCGEVETVPHEEFKRRCAGASFLVRTGENTPYANVILRAGVPF